MEIYEKMRTIKPISTISYNSYAFLKGTLDSMICKGVIDFYAFIKHNAEEDETKDHYHILMLPCCTVDTLQLRKLFVEPCIGLPLGVLPLRTSKIDDWFFYAVHHKGYLMSKGQARKWSYTFDDIECSDEHMKKELLRSCNHQLYRCYDVIFSAHENRIPFSKLVADGIIPLGWIYQFRELYNALGSIHATDRNKKHNHECLLDTEEEDIDSVFNEQINFDEFDKNT